VYTLERIVFSIRKKALFQCQNHCQELQNAGEISFEEHKKDGTHKKMMMMMVVCYPFSLALLCHCRRGECDINWESEVL